MCFKVPDDRWTDDRWPFSLSVSYLSSSVIQTQHNELQDPNTITQTLHGTAIGLPPRTDPSNPPPLAGTLGSRMAVALVVSGLGLG